MCQQARGATSNTRATALFSSARQTKASRCDESRQKEFRPSRKRNTWTGNSSRTLLPLDTCAGRIALSANGYRSVDLEKTEKCLAFRRIKTKREEKKNPARTYCSTSHCSCGSGLSLVAIDRAQSKRHQNEDVAKER